MITLNTPSIQTLKTFQVNNNPQSISNAVLQCQAVLLEMGCSSRVRTFKSYTTVTTEQPLNNSLTGVSSNVRFVIEHK